MNLEDLQPISFKRVSVLDWTYQQERRVQSYYQNDTYAVIAWHSRAWRAHARHCQILHIPTRMMLLANPVTSDVAIKLAHLGGQIEPFNHPLDACAPFLQELRRVQPRGGWHCIPCKQRREERQREIAAALWRCPKCRKLTAGSDRCVSCKAPKPIKPEPAL